MVEKGCESAGDNRRCLHDRTCPPLRKEADGEGTVGESKLLCVSEVEFGRSKGMKVHDAVRDCLWFGDRYGSTFDVVGVNKDAWD